jgi:hypothetical protein
MRQAYGEGVLWDTPFGQRSIRSQPLGKRIHATESGCRGDTEVERVRHQLGKRTRQAGECTQRPIGEELRLQRRAEQRVVLEEAVHVFQLRAADVFVAKAGQAAQADGFQIVRQRRGDVGDHARCQLAHAGYVANAAVGAKGIAMQALEFVKRHWLAGLLARGPAHAIHGTRGLRVEVDQAGVERGKGEEFIRTGHEGLVGFRRAHCRKGAGGADGDKNLVASQHVFGYVVKQTSHIV